MSDVFNVSVREERGTKRARRARAKGQIPAVLYGHGEANVLLSVDAVEVASAIRHGGHLIDLKGGVNESALIKAVQWDAMGIGVLHVDLTRVRKGEKVEVTVPIELHGFAPGAQQGGVVEQTLHEVKITCPVNKLPDKIEVNINQLQLGDVIHVSDLQLDSEIEVLEDAEAGVVNCHEPVVVQEEEGEGDSAEPEVIGHSDEDEGDES
ncbi:50S ribosomal protein L25 [Lignipirellula cremea]|uniref:Large ribosomal subunit protein bL25 n=1 Tax=Lignipirellula cremea TaxID=2528010 RepID=A0A518DLQ3_9BACT|nr:50S ribosomal protein L25 [Lignipirellula cremea]QDU92759.1 50S ribosomal protein L25 [Lignipirellula cremea]